MYIPKNIYVTNHLPPWSSRSVGGGIHFFFSNVIAARTLCCQRKISLNLLSCHFILNLINRTI